MKQRTSLTPLVAATTAALSLGFASLPGWTDEEEASFDEAHLFFELNDTDGDLGIHGKVDGGPWKYIRIEDKNERRMMSVWTRGRLRRQGLTELFFESAEPPFESDDPEEVTLTPEKFFKRFPAGTYEIEGRSQDGEELESEVEITHVMPAPPVPTVNGDPLDEDCDDENYTEVTGSVTIAWPRVDLSHEEIGIPDVDLSDKIVNYEVVVEFEDEGSGFVSVMSVILPPNQTSMSVPAEFLKLSDEFKYEVLAREESDNQTAIESCFKWTEN